LDVVIETLTGTGVQGSVVRADVEQAAALGRATPTAAKASGPSPTRAPRGGFDAAMMRQAIATAMTRSKREIPHYYLSSTIDFEAANSWLESHNRDKPPPDRLLPATLLIKASARALAEVPQLNGFYEGGAFRPGAGIHLGWAIALRGGGLVAPAIHDADKKTLAELMQALRDLVQRARSGGLRSSELTDPTVTVTSLGDRGADVEIAGCHLPAAGRHHRFRPLVQAALGGERSGAATHPALGQPSRRPPRQRWPPGWPVAGRHRSGPAASRTTVKPEPI